MSDNLIPANQIAAAQPVKMSNKNGCERDSIIKNRCH
jgi:hypothetical protein